MIADREVETYLEGREVDDAVNLGVRREDGIERGLVGYVCLMEGGALAADELNAVDGDLGRIVEVIDNNDIVAVLEESERRERTNVAGTSGCVGQLA